MPKSKIIPGRTSQPNIPEAPDLNIVGAKGKNLAGTPRSGGINPKTTPGKKRFTGITKITGSGRNK